MNQYIKLPSGILSVKVERTDIPLNKLCGYGCRQNPKRGFLFISKVLGKHYPVHPQQMRQVQRLLADKISLDLPTPIVFIAMAETATCLGQGVYEAYLHRREEVKDTLFLHTTRYHLNHQLAFVFCEEHSHATNHLVYLPESPQEAQLLPQAKTLVLIDDEASSGKTFSNLASVFQKYTNTLEQAVVVTITDWTKGKVAQKMPLPTQVVSILSGSYSFESNSNFVVDNFTLANGNGSCKSHLLPRNYGRLGCSNFIYLTQEIQQYALSIVKQKISPRVLVVGTGEFAYLPFCLAERLEAWGYEVYFQTTTRSPILVAGDIASKISFPDNYEDNIDNFLYNFQPQDYDIVFIGYETPLHTIQSQLIHLFPAIPLCF